MDALVGVDSFWYSLARFLPDTVLHAPKLTLLGGRAYVNGILDAHPLWLRHLKEFKGTHITSFVHARLYIEHNPMDLPTAMDIAEQHMPAASRRIAVPEFIAGSTYATLPADFKYHRHAICHGFMYTHSVHSLRKVISAVSGESLREHLWEKHDVDVTVRIVRRVERDGENVGVLRYLLTHMKKSRAKRLFYGSSVHDRAITVKPQHVLVLCEHGIRAWRLVVSHADMYAVLEPLAGVKDTLTLGIALVAAAYSERLHQYDTPRILEALRSLDGVLKRTDALHLMTSYVESPIITELVRTMLTERPNPREKSRLTDVDLLMKCVRSKNDSGMEYMVELMGVVEPSDELKAVLRHMLKTTNAPMIQYVFETLGVTKEHLPDDAMQVAVDRNSQDVIAIAMQFGEMPVPPTIWELVKLEVHHDVFMKTLAKFPRDHTCFTDTVLPDLVNGTWCDKRRVSEILRHMSPCIFRHTPGFNQAIIAAIRKQDPVSLSILIERGHMNLEECKLLDLMTDYWANMYVVGVMGDAIKLRWGTDDEKH